MLQFAFVALFITFGLSYVLPVEQQPLAESIGSLVTAALFAVAFGEMLIKTSWQIFSDTPPKILEWIEFGIPSRRSGLKHRYQYQFIRSKMSASELKIYRLVTAIGVCVSGIAILWVFFATLAPDITSVMLSIGLLFAAVLCLGVNERIESKLWNRHKAEFERDYEVVDQEKDGRRKRLVVKRDAPSSVQMVSLN